MQGEDARRRVVIESVEPEVDGGRFPAKRVVGDRVVVDADAFTEGHDAISALLLHRKADEAEWTATPMQPLPNDRWRATFLAAEQGCYRYAVTAWVDHFKSWRRDLAKRVEAGQDVGVDLLIGADLVEQASARAEEPDASTLRAQAAVMRSAKPSTTTIALADDLSATMERWPDRRFATLYDPGLTILVDRPRARYSTWYELFPRSWAPTPGRHGTLRDVEGTLPYVAEMGFDVLYLPPIHPIGTSHRKGKNNAETARADDVGSPWAIGAVEGGHKSIDPRLGTLEDFRHLLARARDHGLEVALDIALQCSPDHPYVREHPEWFRHRPDGTVQYAENPPKKYQDIYPLDFETEAWRELWEELKSIFFFWIDQGVRIFRVDNPHTKPFAFWEWVIAEVNRAYPDVIFLAEAFTRPKVMYRLAKLGFSQSYTYFAWRNTRYELTSYFTELTQGKPRDFFRPNLWPNTPDILTEYLQYGGRTGYMARLVLAATLGASYGIYGPAFELMESEARELGSEEYLNSEKYEIRRRDLDRPDSLRELISLVNRIRREHPALQQDETLHFHSVDNDQIIAYSKRSGDGSDTVVTVVNLDPHHTHSGWLELDLAALDLDPQRPYQMHDLLTGARYLWHGSRNYVELSATSVPAHILAIRSRLRTEGDFDYYM